MDKISWNHHLNWSKEKRSMKSKPFSIIGKEDEDINTMLNGGDTLSPMPHGNRNMPSPMMATHWHNTNNATIFEISSTSSHTKMPFDKQYNVELAFYSCLELVYEILDGLEDIRFAFEQGRNPDFFLPPNSGFDPFKTIGKY
jgi:hypothetical protein